MNWTEMLVAEADDAYRCADNLMTMVEDGDLDWKPATGDNWMTVGQLLRHMGSACGMTSKGFVTNDWGMPENVDPSEMPPDEMLPPAEALLATDSVTAARKALAADKRLTLEMIEAAAERMEDPAPAPWDQHQAPTPLGRQLLGMINHLNNHKAQLFYYLKLQGKPVNTLHYYGMA